MNILIAIENSESLQLVETAALQFDTAVFTATDKKTAWDILESNTIDIFVGSHSLFPSAGNGQDIESSTTGKNRPYGYHVTVLNDKITDTALEELEKEADDLLYEPLNTAMVSARLRIAARILHLEKELHQEYRRIKNNYFQTIHMFANLLEAFDEGLGGHARRVANLCLELARRHPDVPKEDHPVIEAAGLLHDIGMLGLPGEILNKKRTELTHDERLMYRSHPEKGEKIINEIELLRPAAALVRAHHEQYNGRGFPDELSKDEIPIGAQIVSAASVYDNLLYRGESAIESVPEKILQMKGFQLDPQVVDLILEVNLEIQHAEKEKDTLEIHLDDIQEGMMLAKNIHKKTGALLLPARTELTHYGIEKLHNYNRLGLIDHRIHIFKFSVRE